MPAVAEHEIAVAIDADGDLVIVLKGGSFLVGEFPLRFVAMVSDVPIEVLDFAEPRVEIASVFTAPFDYAGVYLLQSVLIEFRFRPVYAIPEMVLERPKGIHGFKRIHLLPVPIAVKNPALIFEFVELVLDSESYLVRRNFNGAGIREPTQPAQTVREVLRPESQVGASENALYSRKPVKHSQSDCFCRTLCRHGRCSSGKEVPFRLK